MSDEPKNWDKFLQSTMFGLRTKKQLTTKYSPYYLMFGREARYPSEIPKAYKVKWCNVQERRCLNPNPVTQSLYFGRLQKAWSLNSFRMKTCVRA